MTRALGLFLSTTCLLVLVACASDSAGETCSSTGQACACSGDCSRKCETQSGTGCQFTCAAGKTCSFDCASGDCQVTCGSGSTCTVGCAGGGCRVTAEATSSLDVTCGNKGTCTVACTDTKKCTVDGAPGIGSSGGLPGVPATDADE